MMLTVICKKCHSEFFLRGWLEKEDLKGTSYENKINTITEDELQELEQKGIIKDEWDRFLDNPICPDCGSNNVIYF
jgi:DNA-directed RNA polymerase subunit M/transcription elongation factor TFIIS